MRNGVIFQLVMSPEQNASIDDFRFANRIPSRSEAIRQLIDMGLAAKPKKAARNAG